MNKISFKVSLVFLIWVSALIPVSLLTYNFTQDKIAQFVELQQQKLVNSATKSANKSKQYLDESISAIDKLAIDGGIIVSASLDIMSVKAVKKLKSFLSNYAEFESIMLLDADLFQMEAYPTSALKIPLAAINKELTEIIQSDDVISTPETRLILVRSSVLNKQITDPNKYTICLVRPILKPNKSLLKPFEVIGLVFVSTSLDRLVQSILDKTDVSIENVSMAIRYRNEVVFSTLNDGAGISQPTYSEKIYVGANNEPLIIDVALDKSAQTLLQGVDWWKNTEYVYLLTLLVVISTLAVFISRAFIRPIKMLKTATTALSTDINARKKLAKLSGSKFKEFDEVFQLLLKMSGVIDDQLEALKSKNKQVSETAEELSNNLEAEALRHEDLKKLMQFALTISNEGNAQEVISCAETLLTFFDERAGIVIYRSEYYNEYATAANCQFIASERGNNYYLNRKEIDNYNKLSHQCSFTAITANEKLVGYVIRSTGVSDYRRKMIQLLCTLLQSYLDQFLLRKQLENLANSDSLTGVANRHLFERSLEENIANYHHKAKRSDFAILLIDINGLKEVNDEHGHEAGDMLLVAACEFFNESKRESDLLARIGGDEFVLLMNGMNSSECDAYLKKLKITAQSKFLQNNDANIHLAFSCGFACTDNDSVSELVAIADNRMYKDKREDYIPSQVVFLHKDQDDLA